MVRDRHITALTISRKTGIARTKVYRLLDNLIKQGLVYTAIGERGTIFKATPPSDLELLLLNKENELKKLTHALPRLQVELASLAATVKDEHQINYYHGIEGIKQVTYNSLKTKGELLTYEMASMDAFMEHAEAEKYRQKFVDNKVYIRTLTNSTRINAWTDVTPMVRNYWQVRHLSPINNKPFQFEILIYNNTYAMYRYVSDEIFCIEIENRQLADMQRQIFESLWSNAKELRILNDHGAAQLE